MNPEVPMCYETALRCFRWVVNLAVHACAEMNVFMAAVNIPAAMFHDISDETFAGALPPGQSWFFPAAPNNKSGMDIFAKNKERSIMLSDCKQRFARVFCGIWGIDWVQGPLVDSSYDSIVLGLTSNSLEGFVPHPCSFKGYLISKPAFEVAFRKGGVANLHWHTDDHETRAGARSAAYATNLVAYSILGARGDDGFDKCNCVMQIKCLTSRARVILRQIATQPNHRIDVCEPPRPEGVDSRYMTSPAIFAPIEGGKVLRVFEDSNLPDELVKRMPANVPADILREMRVSRVWVSGGDIVVFDASELHAVFNFVPQRGLAFNVGTHGLIAYHDA